ncbi:DUF6049 family protein [Streptomyces sp. NPDC059524]|uniref:DUF6049 family protein n=1 Tax=Streptomyces sp. NPDC059524 TaxID=3346856 RepID=UPI003697E6E6
MAAAGYGAAARALVVSAVVLGAAALPGPQARAADHSEDDPLRAAVVWPVTAPPHLTAASLGAGPTAQAVFDDDALAGLFAEGGRLREVVDAGKGHDVNWVVDPDLVIAAHEMADGYRVAGPDGSSNPQDSVRGTGQGAARAWLAALKDAVDGHDVWLLPYADPDLASLAHHPGPDRDDLTEAVTGLASGARTEVDQLLGISSRAGLGWPADGALDRRITALGTRFGVTRMLTSGQGLDPDEADPVTLGKGDDALTALPYDAAVTKALTAIKDPERPSPTASPSPSAAPSASGSPSPDASGASPSPSKSASSRSEAEKPDEGAVTDLSEQLRTGSHHVVVPPRELSGRGARTLAAALDAGGEDGWLELETLRSAGNEAVDGTAGPSAEYPAALRAKQLSARQLAAAAGDLDGLATLSKVLADPRATTESVHAAMARALSTAWRGRPAAEQEAFQERTTDFLTASVASLRLVPKTTVTLTSGDAQIPVSVDNALQQPVAGLELRVTSSDSERLRVNDPAVAVQAAGSANHTTHIGVTARANGKAELTAQLYTRSDGKPWGDPITFEVDVTSVSTGAIVVVAAGVGLIVLAAGFRMWQVRKRRSAQKPPEEEETAGEE